MSDGSLQAGTATTTDATTGASAGDTREVVGLWRLLLRRPSVVGAAVGLLLIVGAVVLAGVVAPWPPLHQDLAAVYQGPSARHPFGTDDLGRDVLSRLLFGGRPTLLGALQAVLVFAVVGVVTGLLAGLSDGWIDELINRFAEVVMSVPSFVTLLVVLALVPGSVGVAMMVAGLLASPQLMRLVRGNVKSLRNELYVRAARTSGLTTMQTAVRHLLPRLAGPIIVQLTVISSAAIMIETGLGYLGFGTRIPQPSWGNLVTTASGAINVQPWLLVPTGGTIALTVLCLALLGDGLRDALAERWTGTTPSAQRRDAVRTLRDAGDRLVGAGSTAEMPDTGTPAVVDVRGLTLQIDTADGPTTLVSDVSFQVRKGRCLALVGQSGSGKSITALALLGLSRGPRVTGGTIALDGTDLASLTPGALRTLRSSFFGFITQDPQSSLDPSMTVGTFLTRMLQLHTGADQKTCRAQVPGLLAKVDIADPEATAARYPHELSGGMAQRVVIAAALSGEPAVLVADEPTTALDVTVQAEILALLHDLCEGTEMSLLLITHDWGVVADIADDVAVLEAGRIIETAPAAEIFTSATQPATRTMLAADPWHVQRKVREQAPALVQVRDLAIDYPSGGGKTFRAVEGVSFELQQGRTLGLVGESGSGKSSIGNTLVGLATPAQGTILFDGRDITHPDAGQRRALTHDIQVIFQDAYSSLNPVRTVGATLADTLVLAQGMDRGAARDRISETLERVGLPARAAQRYPAQFSGGQRQRLAIARAVVGRPKLVVCDEPVSALDLSIQRQVLDLLAELQEDLGMSYLFISHDLAVVRSFCDDIMVLRHGAMIETGPTASVCADPEDAYTRALLTAAPVPDPTVQRGRSKQTRALRVAANNG